MTIRLAGRASVTNSIQISKAPFTISNILSSVGLFTRDLNIKQAKSPCTPCKRNTLQNIHNIFRKFVRPSNK